jgi:hypothetical protein
MSWESVDFNEVRDVVALKQLLGGRATVRRMVPGQHPLALGLAAFDDYLMGRQLSFRQSESLAQLHIDSRHIFGLRRCWEPSGRLFAGELLRSESCRERLFELDVYRSCLRHCEGVVWTHFQPGATDFVVSRPHMRVERKHIYAEWSLERLRRKVEEARDQHDRRPGLVVRRDSQPTTKLGLRGTAWANRTVVEVRNDAATLPLPDTFKFDTDSLRVGRFALA